MTRTETFFDTNVLLYLASGSPAKAQTAERLIERGGLVSVQVLDEFASVASHKFRAAWPAIHDLLTAVRANLAITSTDLQTHEFGLYVAERYRYSVYDSMLIAAALQAGCTTFWSEDLHNGQLIDGQLTIRNPFI